MPYFRLFAPVDREGLNDVRYRLISVSDKN
jgi:hypothetical protein